MKGRRLVEGADPGGATTEAAIPSVQCEQHHTILYVPDLEAAVEFYTTRLAFWKAFEWGEPATLAGVNIGHVQIFLEQGEPSVRKCAVYFVVGDADKLHAYHQARGVEVVDPLSDRPWKLREYTVRDLNGYTLTFGHRLGGGEKTATAP